MDQQNFRTLEVENGPGDDTQHNEDTGLRHHLSIRVGSDLFFFCRMPDIRPDYPACLAGYPAFSWRIIR